MVNFDSDVMDLLEPSGTTKDCWELEPEWESTGVNGTKSSRTPARG